MTIAQRTCDDATRALAEELADAVVVSSVSRLMGGSPPPVRFGQFSLVRLLGRGGAGTVYQAVDTATGRDVALKVLHGPSRLAAETECRALAGLRHPGLVRYHGLHSIDGLHCVSMELVCGETLSDWALPSKRSTEQVDDVIRQISDALVFLHGHGITHGDVKPSNIVVDADSRAILLDFGLASVAAPREPVRRRGRSAGYSPEGAMHQRPSDDWYALGCLLARLDTGQGPLGVAKLRGLAHALKARVHTDTTAWAQVADALGLRSAVQTHAARVGRVAESTKLATWLRPSSSGAVTLLVGESGSGKTALARSVLEDLVTRDALARVFSARCNPASSTALESLAESICTFVELQPRSARAFYIPLHRNALAAVIPAFDRLPVLPQAVAPSDERDVTHRAALALHDLFARISASHSVILWIDDAQWLESGAWDVLSTLFQRGMPAGTRVLLSARTEHSAAALMRERLEACGVSPNTLRLTTAKLRSIRSAPVRGFAGPQRWTKAHPLTGSPA